MTYKYLISKLASLDIEESFRWYEERSKQAANNFTIELEDAIEKIRTNPKIGNNKYADSYELRLKKYPFTVIYLIVEKEKLIIVTGVFHMKRHPNNKYRKV